LPLYLPVGGGAGVGEFSATLVLDSTT
jgi:hypothetical protein